MMACIDNSTSTENAIAQEQNLSSVTILQSSAPQAGGVSSSSQIINTVSSYEGSSATLSSSVAVASVSSTVVATPCETTDCMMSSSVIDHSSSSFQSIVVIAEKTTFVDERDGYEYSKVSIGNQVWMAENLRYLPQVDDKGSSYSDIFSREKYWYVSEYVPTGASEAEEVQNAKKTEQYKTFGVLYNWYAVMNGMSVDSTVSIHTQGICPDDWHVPSDSEWVTLADYVATEKGLTEKNENTWKQIAPILKSTSGWGLGLATDPTDDYGFSALPGGFIGDGTLYEYTAKGYWWSATEEGSWWAKSFNLNLGQDYFLWRSNKKASALSVRCIKDS